MYVLRSDLEDPYVPFVTSRHPSFAQHEIRRLERRNGGPRRTIGRALVRAGLAFAGLDHPASR